MGPGASAPAASAVGGDQIGTDAPSSRAARAGIDAAIQCANVISQLASENEQLRADAAKTVASCKDMARHLRTALEEMTPAVADSASLRMATARVLDVARLLESAT